MFYVVAWTIFGHFYGHFYGPFVADFMGRFVIIYGMFKGLFGIKKYRLLRACLASFMASLRGYLGAILWTLYMLHLALMVKDVIA